MAIPQDVYDRTAEVYRIVDTAQATGWSDAPTQSALGSIKDYCNQIDALVHELTETPAPAPPPDPAPTPTYQGFAVTYAGHDPARDCYLGLTPDQKEWGEHHGLAVLAPAPGRVELYQFPTPLNLPMLADPDYAQHAADLWGGGWICMAPAPDPTQPGAPLVGAQAMFVAVEWFDTPLRLANGQWVVWFGIGHCRNDIAVGRVSQGDRVCTSWDSGVRFENNGIQARAAHCHLIGGATTTLSMNGDLDAMLLAQALGWQVEYRGATGPGPNDYLAGNYVAGKPRSQWVGRALPPMPS
jgi:hypothetical protein